MNRLIAGGSLLRKPPTQINELSQQPRVSLVSNGQIRENVRKTIHDRRSIPSSGGREFANQADNDIVIGVRLD